MVVQNSGRLGEIEIAGGDKEEHGRIMRETPDGAGPADLRRPHEPADSSTFDLSRKRAAVRPAAAGPEDHLPEAPDTLPEFMAMIPGTKPEDYPDGEAPAAEASP